jgi:hypothetical protein
MLVYPVYRLVLLTSSVSAPSIAEEEIRGTIYLLTYSEQQNLTCITTYVVPMDASIHPSLAASAKPSSNSLCPF